MNETLNEILNKIIEDIETEKFYIKQIAEDPDPCVRSILYGKIDGLCTAKEYVEKFIKRENENVKE
jgi:hypothetical protein